MFAPRRTLLPVLVTLAAGAVLGGCAAQAPSLSAAPAPAAVPDSRFASSVAVDATFGTDGVAVTYDPALVPVGAQAKVTGETSGTSSVVTLAVTGLLPNRTYGAHAHQKPCGPAAADSGAHFQHTADPVKPSVDPAFANPVNEVWLDFTTDAEGAGSVTATQSEWAFTEQAAPRSVVIHALPTSTEPGKAGTAGDRAGCVSAEF
ncbi:superoxide dismutase family protein [Pseudonocardia pini]|uniref:superoxide dismutase family protein n=1 Tax=Pseudonocardia pini TaxID=2758030 RepID=UPI0015F02D69|nr:superoxide dismutase family protein [Pseudonocardia pini]